MTKTLRLLSPSFRAGAILAFALLFVAGCETTGGGTQTRRNPVLPNSENAAALRPGDNLVVVLQGIPDPSSNQLQIDDKGIISLPFIGALKASGETAAVLAEKIREIYISKKIYNTLDVSVTATERYIYVGGEVIRPGRVVWAPDLTVSKAIQAAGGFALYAKESKVTLVRDGKSYMIDSALAAKSPDEDPRMLPGDSLNVPKTAF